MRFESCANDRTGARPSTRRRPNSRAGCLPWESGRARSLHAIAPDRARPLVRARASLGGSERADGRRPARPRAADSDHRAGSPERASGGRSLGRRPRAGAAPPDRTPGKKELPPPPAAAAAAAAARPAHYFPENSGGGGGGGGGGSVLTDRRLAGSALAVVDCGRYGKIMTVAIIAALQ